MSSPASPVPTPLEVSARAFDALNEHDLHQLRSLMADDVVQHIVPVGVHDGLEAVLAYYEEVFAAAPDLRIDVTDVAADGEVVARGYLIGSDQLDEVHSLERRYDSRSKVGDRDGLPMVALTSSEHHEPAAPSAAYLRTILTGLTDGLLEVDAAITYLLSAPGVDLRWDEAELREMAEQPTAGRG